MKKLLVGTLVLGLSGCSGLMEFWGTPETPNKTVYPNNGTQMPTREIAPLQGTMEINNAPNQTSSQTAPNYYQVPQPSYPSNNYATQPAYSTQPIQTYPNTAQASDPTQNTNNDVSGFEQGVLQRSEKSPYSNKN